VTAEAARTCVSGVPITGAAATRNPSNGVLAAPVSRFRAFASYFYHGQIYMSARKLTLGSVCKVLPLDAYVD